MTSENNIRRKAIRRGYRINKYGSSCDGKYAASHWQKSSVDILDANLEELEKFIDSKPLEKTMKGGSR